MRNPKSEMVSFKAEPALIEAMQGLPNRSEFIRAAVLSALESACPLCRGTGILTPGQKEHWDGFARSHQVRECDECHELHLVCAREAAGPARRRPLGGSRARRR